MPRPANVKLAENACRVTSQHNVTRFAFQRLILLAVSSVVPKGDMAGRTRSLGIYYVPTPNDRL
jgi:hypothetical protein